MKGGKKKKCNDVVCVLRQLCVLRSSPKHAWFQGFQRENEGSNVCTTSLKSAK